MLPQWVRAKPGRQTHFGATGQNFAYHVNKLTCSQHVPINIMLRCAVGVPGTPGPTFGYGLPIPRVTPSAGAQNTREVGKIGDFRLKSPFI